MTALARRFSKRRLVSLVGLALVSAAPAGAGSVAIVPVVTEGLSGPLGARHAGDGSGRLFVMEQEGIIRIWDGTQLLATPFLDITERVLAGGEQGLLGLDFDPDYETNGFFYASYNFNPPGVNPDNCNGDPAASLTRVSRFSVSGDPDIGDPNSESVILDVVQDFSNHNGGDIHFGPDGYLYISRGDGGDGGDSCENAQDPLVLRGKMLRIDVSGSAFGGGRLTQGSEDCGLVGNYAIPPDNPFANDADGTCNEIWAFGLRNPWRWSFDRETGDMFIGDVGQEDWEEVSFEPATSSGGSNWGWDCYEGNEEFELGGCGPVGDYDFPILDYSSGGSGTPNCPGSAGNAAVAGGYRYRGLRAPSLRGTYIFGDTFSGRVYFGVENGGNWTCTEFSNTTLFITAFGEDQEGEVYVVDGNGGLHRFEEPIVFADGFELGDTSRWDVTTN